MIEVSYQCPRCCQWVSATVDPGGGQSQRYVEDCSVCCAPSVLSIQVDLIEQTATIDAQPES